jgi:hypothetical protein
MTPLDASAAYAVAVVGVGPRGLSVVERLVIHLRRSGRRGPVTIWAVDPVEHGCGRVWRTGQPEWLTMNATGGEVTVRSPDSHLTETGLVEWTAGDAWPRSPVGPVDYPPRRVYGAYLKDVFTRLCASAPPNVTIRPVTGAATALSKLDGRMVLTVAGAPLRVDKVVLATGHGLREPQELTAEQRAFPVGRYLAGDIAPDMPLDKIEPQSTVAVRGLGLSFYDIVRTFSVGRGGEFRRDQSGRLRYRPSGEEPRVVAGSRGGLPFLARASFDRTPETAPRPTVLTEERLGELRARARTMRGTDKLDFAREVEPLIVAEAQAAHDACAARNGLPAANLRLDALARPFDGQHFAGPAAFRQRLVDVLRRDVAEARKGAHASPVKAALEMLRTIRPLLPSVVDFGGLLPESHRDFLTRFAPWSFILSAGPPDTHVEQLAALIEVGVVEVAGPAARFGFDGQDFTVCSPHVEKSLRTADFLIEARIPVTDIRRSTAPLTRQLLADGVISEFVNTDPVTGSSFATGGMAVTPAPCRVVDARGTVDRDIYAIGVATEHTRWFTQVGTGRPGKDSPFCREADAIAGDIVRSEGVLP